MSFINSINNDGYISISLYNAHHAPLSSLPRGDLYIPELYNMAGSHLASYANIHSSP